VNPDLSSAVDGALLRTDVRVFPSPVSSYDITNVRNEEYARLAMMRKMGAMKPLAARLLLLTRLGWKRTEIAEAMDVSRVTLNHWLRDHTNGADTFKPYGPDALEGDPLSPAGPGVHAPVYNFLSPHAAFVESGLRFQHDKFVVPEGFVGPLGALWRVAYRARGPELTTDVEVAAAGDALDVVISVLLRRGVTNLAIAKAAGVTHRAVLDRMNRARARGLILDCADDRCEAFLGEADLLGLWSLTDLGLTWHEDQYSALLDGDRWVTNLDSLDPLGRLTPVRLTSARPSRYWLQTMTDGDKAFTVSIGEHPAEHCRLRTGLFPCYEDEAALVSLDEVTLSAYLGRMNEDSPLAGAVAETLRSNVTYVPTVLLYTEAVEKLGVLPSTAGKAFEHIPKGLRGQYFDEHELVLKCFTDIDEIEAEYSATAKHKTGARTRRGAA
jgi:hypothetical protein